MEAPRERNASEDGGKRGWRERGARCDDPHGECDFVVKLWERERPSTGISSQIRTKLRDWDVWQARAGIYPQAALSSNDSKTLYKREMEGGPPSSSSLLRKGSGLICQRGKGLIAENFR